MGRSQSNYRNFHLQLCEVMDMSISLIMAIICIGIKSRCIGISNLYIVHLKYVQFLFVRCTSIKLGEEAENK